MLLCKKRQQRMGPKRPAIILPGRGGEWRADRETNAKQAVRFTRLDTAVIHCKLNDDAANTTVTNDGSGANGTATANTSVLNDDGKVGDSFAFNGSSHYVNMGDVDFTGAFSVCAWVYTHDVTNNTARTIVAKWDAGSNKRSITFGINYNGSGKLFAARSSDGTNYVTYSTGAGEVLTVNTWHHVALTYDGNGSAVKFWIDGVQQTTTEIATSGTLGNGNYDHDQTLRIGCMQTWSGSTRYWDGNLDDVRVFDRELNQFEIDYIYNDGDGTEDVTADQYADVAAHADLVLTNNDAFTWLARIWIPEVTNYDYQIIYYYAAAGNNRSWLLRTDAPSGKLQMSVYHDGSTVTNLLSAAGVNAGAWNTVACVHDPDSDIIAVYLNGVYKSQAHTTGVYDGGGKDHTLNRFGTTRSWVQFENVRYFNSALTETEIAAEFASAKPVLTPIYNFECDSNDGVLVDGQGNHDATITGGSTLVDGYWTHTADDGDNIYSVGDLLAVSDATQDNPAARPVYDADAFGNQPGWLFDFVDDYLDLGSTPPFREDTAGTCFVVFKLTNLLAADGAMTFLARGHSNGAFCGLGVRAKSATYTGTRLCFSAKIGGTTYLHYGDTQLVAGTTYVAAFRTDGSTWRAWLNGQEETLADQSGNGNSGSWFGDVGDGAMTIGATEDGGEIHSYLDGTLGHIIPYRYAMSDGQIDHINDALISLYGATRL